MCILSFFFFIFCSALSYILGRIKGLLLFECLFFFTFLSVGVFFVGVKFALPSSVASFFVPFSCSRLRTKISLIRYKAVAFKFI